MPAGVEELALEALLCRRCNQFTQIGHSIRLEKSRRPCLVANQATLPQKWPPPTRNLADSCELTAPTKQEGVPFGVEELPLEALPFDPLAGTPS